jgi:hypothetical protein
MFVGHLQRFLNGFFFFFAILSLTLCERNQDEQYRKL